MSAMRPALHGGAGVQSTLLARDTDGIARAITSPEHPSHAGVADMAKQPSTSSPALIRKPKKSDRAATEHFSWRPEPAVFAMRYRIL